MTAYDKSLQGGLTGLPGDQWSQDLQDPPKRFSYDAFNRQLAKLPPVGLVAVLLSAAVLVAQIIATFNTFWMVEYLGLFGAKEETFVLTALNVLITTVLVALPLVLLCISAIDALDRSRHKLRGLRDVADRANAAKSEFLSNMSHELRTPLNAIIGFSEIIENETFGPVGNAKYRDYAADINESGQHLLNIINDILDLSKIESGEAHIADEIIEIEQLARSVLVLLGGMAQSHAIKIVVEISHQLPKLRADRRMTKQILLNLLSNGVKFSPAHSRVTLRAWCDATGELVLQVADDGIGIAAEDIPKAMARFAQVDGVLNRRYDGTGLGLPLVEALVELHGGRMNLESRLGAGTAVTVRFPPERVVRSPYDTKAGGATGRKAG